MNTEKKQTAVEWYINQRDKLEYNYHFEGIRILKYFEIKKEIETQAKQMEKEQIEMGWDNGEIDHSYGKMYKNFEDYYNANYGETKN
jgi:hypothetical protein